MAVIMKNKEMERQAVIDERNARLNDFENQIMAYMRYNHINDRGGFSYLKGYDKLIKQYVTMLRAYGLDV